MFNTDSTITIGLRTATGKADITVRWPNDEEWAAHRRRRKIMQVQLGRGQTETQIDTGEADAKLYDSIKLNGAQALTQAEATRIIDTLATCDVIDVQLGAESADVTLNTLMGETKHTVRIPTMDEVRTLQKSTRLISLPYNRQEIRTNLDAAASLWDKCGGKGEAYEGPVPAVHKDSAIRAVISAIEQEAMPKYDESNF
ncbi:MAG TPA: hypothetical protein VGG62_10775 [Terracidiphilus sp.]